MATLGHSNLFRRIRGNHAAAPFAGLRPKPEDPVCGPSDFKFGLDHQDTVAGLHQCLQHIE